MADVPAGCRPPAPGCAARSSRPSRACSCSASACSSRVKSPGCLAVRLQGTPRCSRNCGQRLQPRRVRLVVDAVEAGLARLGELAGRRHVGGDHELLDQHVAGQADARARCRRARPSASKMILRSGSSSSIVPRRWRASQQPLVGGVERQDHRLQQRAPCSSSGWPSCGRLDLGRRSAAPGCASARGRTARSGSRPCRSMRDPDREAGALLVRAQRAQVVGERLRQHRDDAVGEIDRVAAVRWPRGRARCSGGHSGRRRRSRPAAGGRPGCPGLDRLGPDRVVEVARVLAVDGDRGRRGAGPRACRAPPAAPRRPAPAPRAGRSSAGPAPRRSSGSAPSDRPGRPTRSFDLGPGQRPAAGSGTISASDEVAGLGPAQIVAGRPGTRPAPCGRRSGCAARRAAGSTMPVTSRGWRGRTRIGRAS